MLRYSNRLRISCTLSTWPGVRAQDSNDRAHARQHHAADPRGVEWRVLRRTRRSAVPTVLVCQTSQDSHCGATGNECDPTSKATPSQRAAY